MLRVDIFGFYHLIAFLFRKAALKYSGIKIQGFRAGALEGTARWGRVFKQWAGIS